MNQQANKAQSEIKSNSDHVGVQLGEGIAPEFKRLSFDVTKEESAIIRKIADRADKIFLPNFIEQTKLETIMDLSACHANGCPLRLQELLDADEFNFAHDVCGIRRHINRTTGQLEDCFMPRFSKGD